MTTTKEEKVKRIQALVRTLNKVLPLYEKAIVTTERAAKRINQIAKERK